MASHDNSVNNWLGVRLTLSAPKCCAAVSARNKPHVMEAESPPLRPTFLKAFTGKETYLVDIGEDDKESRTSAVVVRKGEQVRVYRTNTVHCCPCVACNF